MSDVSDYVTGDEQDIQISFEDIENPTVLSDISEVPINNQRKAPKNSPHVTRSMSEKVIGQFIRHNPRARYCSDSVYSGVSFKSLKKRNKSCPSFQKRSTKEKENKRRVFEEGEIEMVDMSHLAERPEKTQLIHKSKRGANLGRAFTFYGRSMKDNRLKSSIRKHAMATRRHSESVFDDCAVDALSKEDLMVLWKKSEIELQTSLNRVTQENAHLKRLLRVVEVSEKSPQEEAPDRETAQLTATPL